MMLKLSNIFILLFAIGLFFAVNGESIDSVGMPADEEVVIEKPEMVEDDGSVFDTKDETLKVKANEFLDINQIRKNAPYYSFLLPGLGHYKLDRKKAAKSFMLADAGLWIGFAYAMFHRSKITEDLRAFLYNYGRCDGVRSDVAGKSAWNLNEKELQLPLYNDSSAQYAKSVYKPSRDESMIKPDFYWSWSSEDAHQKYYDMWRERNTAKVVGLYFAGAALLNRVGSFIHTRWIAKNSDTIENSYNDNKVIWSPYLNGDYTGLGLSVNF